MSATALDTSIIVAGLLAWHEAHAIALRALVAAAAPRGERLLLPAPALIEAWAVMTRLPAPHRLAPSDARDLLVGSFRHRADVVSLGDSKTWEFLEDTASRGVAGGRTYDALIVRCAVQGGAAHLLTLDRRNFERLDLAGIELVVPDRIPRRR